MSAAVAEISANAWRQETPGAKGWRRSVRASDPNRYLMVSTDAHFNEPDSWIVSMEPELASFLPHVVVDEKGEKWTVQPGNRRARLVMREDEGDAEDIERARAARSVEQIVADMDRDGVDLQIVFPNKGLMTFAIPDERARYGIAQSYNAFLQSYFGPARDRLFPMALVPTSNLDLALQEVDRVIESEFFHGVMLPTKPIFGAPDPEHPNYNLPIFDSLWARLQDAKLAIAFHVSTGMDPRKARGNGGAVINYACHAMTSAVEPLTNMCASGVLERFPGLRFATIEAGIGWVPATLHAMDEAYKKHYLWVRPKLSRLPSEYYLEHGFSSFQEDPIGLALLDQGPFENCFMWANDYPHAEGSWPHSGPAIERQMSGLTEIQRTKILGENAVRCFGLKDAAAARLKARAAA